MTLATAPTMIGCLPAREPKESVPIWGQSIMRKQIHPALEKLGIEKRIGWHTFRHSYSTLLRLLAQTLKFSRICCGIHRRG